MKSFCAIFAVCIAAASAALPNLIDLAKQNNCSTLVSLIQQAGLTDVLSNQGPFTLLAPVDAAFAKLPADVVKGLTADTNALTGVLQYHVIKESIFTWDLQQGEVIPSLNDHSIRVYVGRTSNSIYFNQAKVIVSELQASNGVLYLIDEVLNVPEGTIDDIILNPDYDISGFMDFIKEARLTQTFNRTSGQRYTMFVPSNEALANADQNLMSSIKNSYSRARYLVDYHVHAGTLHAKSLSKDARLSTLYRGHYISVSHDTSNMTLLNNVAKINIADIEAEDGVVHIISHVLIPSTLASGGIVG
ncbi:hypothetical protein FSP39_020008 [Pinctada imbricata]|uniref:FAS1 domain-containing protein n=1 Tax=Pinctada imbricata TaxID=66713 RepID=A0AA88YF10_PINIB|nr:hypothetical protein FSP39_020008 [Pinctada imbricata]